MSFFFSFLFFRLPSNWERERERVHKIGYKEKWSQSLLIFFLWWSSCGESFFFYGLIDFILFLTLAWRKWLLRVSQNFFVFFYPEYLACGSVSYEPCPTTKFFLFYFRWREGVPHFRFRVPANRLASTFQCQATRVRSPSINIRSPLWPIFFLNGHSLTACYC